MVELVAPLDGIVSNDDATANRSLIGQARSVALRPGGRFVLCSGEKGAAFLVDTEHARSRRAG
jgi:hypothetical protein